MTRHRVFHLVTDTAAAVMSVLLLIGCGSQSFFLDSQGDTLFQAFDTVAAPGAEVDLIAKIQAGDYLGGVQGRSVQFVRNGAVVGQAVTDSTGIARVKWTAPTQIGQHELSAQLQPSGDDPTAYDAEPLLVSVLTADQKILLSDIDDTISHSPARDILFGTPDAFDDAADVLKRARSAGYSLVYLTHRPDYYTRKSRMWLADKGFPRAPILTSDVEGFVSGSGTFKTKRLGQLMQTHTNVQVAVGDKISDCQAYTANGVPTAIRIMTMASTPSELRAQATELEGLDPSVHVVTSWKQVEKIIFEGASYPRTNMQAMLRAKASSP